MGARTTRKITSAGSIALALFAGAWMSSASFATDLVYNGAPVTPILTASPTVDGATHLFGTGVVPFSSLPTGVFNGSLETDVYNNDPANVYGAAALTFTFLITNNATVDADALHRFVATKFTGFRVDDTGYSNVFGGVVPSSMDQSASGSGVGFNFPPPNTIGSGSTAAMLIIHTNATAYTTAIDSVIDDETAFVASLGPTVVPEPTTIGLIGLATLGLVGRRRR